MAANGDSDALMVYPSGRKRLLSTGMVVFLVVSAAAPLTAMAGNMPIGLSFPAGLGMPMAFVVVAAILACFAVGYAELSRAVKGTGAFYTYIGRGLGKPAGVVAAYCACSLTRPCRSGSQRPSGISARSCSTSSASKFRG